MALVYRAKDRHLEREVAIKVLPFSLAFDSEFVERFQREARTAAQLEHPNIIPIYRVGRSGRVIYFVMKFLRGGSLSTVLAERRKLTPPEIRRVLTEAGSALGSPAQPGIAHRDARLLEMTRVFAVPWPRRVAAVDVPGVLPYFVAGCRTGIGLAWKSGIAAEVIGRIDMGVAVFFGHAGENSFR